MNRFVKALRSLWLPTPYIVEGIALSMTTLLPVVMYSQLGLSGNEITFFLSLMNLPWVIRPLWHKALAPLSVRRWWAMVLQMVLVLTFSFLAFAMHTRTWLGASIVLLWIAVFATAAYGDMAETFFALTTPENRYYHYNKLRAAAYGLSQALVLGVMVMVAGNLQVLYRNNILYSWSIVLYGAAGIFIILWLWHLFILPRVARGRNNMGKVLQMPADVARASFLGSPKAIAGSIFLLLYPVPAGLLHRSTELFLIDNAGNGGMALSPQEFGLAWGTIGVVALMAGIVAGSSVIRHRGFAHVFISIALCMFMPGLFLLWLSVVQPYSLATVSFALALCQLSLGFGMSPYLHVVGHYGRGEGQATPNLVAVGLAAFGLMAGSMFSGALQKMLGYPNFYLLATLSALLPLIVSLIFIPLARNGWFCRGKDQMVQ